MAGSHGFKPVYSSRYVYNSNYVDKQLLDVQQVKKMLAMYRYTKPNILFSDVVKMKPVLHTVTNCVNTDSVKAKIGFGKNNQQSGTYNVVPTCVSKYKDIMVKRQKVGHSKNIEKCTDSIANTCHVNRFAVLQTVNSDSVDNNEVISTVVEDACNTDCQSTGTAKIERYKQGKQEGKKILNVNTVNCQPRSPDDLVNESNCRVHPQPANTSHNRAFTAKINTVVGVGDMDEGDKYALEITTALKGEKIRVAKESTVNKKFLDQNQPLFGFIPIYGLQSRIHDSNSNTVCKDILSLHERLKKTDTPNYRGLQVPVHSKLNYQKWSQYLTEYWDWELPLLIKYGFPLDFDRKTHIVSEKINHKSATQYPGHVDFYLEEEIRHGAMLGPFSEPPIQNLHTSPFMTRDKSSSDKRRVIIDLSWPLGNSVNSGVTSDKYLDTDFVLTYPPIDNITDQVLHLGRGCKIFKVDISRAFRHVPIDPRDLDLLGLHWGSYFLDFSLPFGFKHGSSIFQRISDSVRFIMKEEGHQVWNYIDDFLCISLPSKINETYVRLQELLAELGLTVSNKKLVPPSTQVVCLGILVDTVQCTISIPPDKLQYIKQLCHSWAVKSTCTKKELQSLLGSLLYVAKCIKYARVFLNRMLQLLRTNYSIKKIQIDDDFRKDLKWFNTFLPIFNGVTFFHYNPSKTVYLDACPTGLGAIYDSQVYAMTLPSTWKDDNIAQLEMINILVALKVWHRSWSCQRVLIKCDNLAVVSVLNNGRARDQTLAKYARNIFMWASAFNDDLKVVHVAGKMNPVADLLSRWNITPHNFQKLQDLVGPVTWIPVDDTLLYTDESI